MPKTGRFTLEERMAVLALIKPKVGILDSFLSDAHATDGKKEAWESITKEFIKNRRGRQDLTSKEIRELWRRMKHKARMEVRQSIQNAKVGHVRTVAETDSMGWLPDNSNTSHKVIDINDLGLEVDTKFITDFVPLLEEEATVLETRNGVLQDYKEKSAVGKRRASTSLPPSEVQKVVRTDVGATSMSVDDVIDIDIVEVLDRSTPVVKAELTDRPSPSRETQNLICKDDTPCGIQITSVVSQQPQYPTDNTTKSVPLHYAQRMKTTMNSTMSSNMNSTVNSDMKPNMNTSMTTNAVTAKETSKDLTELSIQFLKQEHEAKMELIRLKQAAAKAKTETARAKRSAYDEKRMFYFEKRKQLHDIGV